jgi:DnaK suppressor protein
MPKTTKVKKKVTKPKTKAADKPKAAAKIKVTAKTKAAAKPKAAAKIKVTAKPKAAAKVTIKISKTYVPKDTEKYMCEKHKVFFRMRLTEWKKELVKANNEALYFGSMDDNSISADVVDQASSYTDKNVEMKAINRQIKLISEIDKALARIREDIYGYCLDTAEPIGLKRLIARPVAKYTIAAQEKHEKNEKVHADD